MKFATNCFDGAPCAATSTGCLIGTCQRTAPTPVVYMTATLDNLTLTTTLDAARNRVVEAAMDEYRNPCTITAHNLLNACRALAAERDKS